MAKRVFDIFFSLIGLLILFPILCCVAISIKIDSSGPVFFRQTRIGQFSKPFNIFKFRTMRVNSESLGGQITVDRDQRVTRVGSLLRHYKLDELPQLINVLLGEMSLVGPRPEVPKFVEFYTREDKEIIHSVKPGITDNASIEYINESQLLIEFSNAEENYIKEILPRKIDLYKIYIANRSFFGDIKIIFHTIFSIFR